MKTEYIDVQLRIKVEKGITTIQFLDSKGNERALLPEFRTLAEGQRLEMDGIGVRVTISDA